MPAELRITIWNLVLDEAYRTWFPDFTWTRSLLNVFSFGRILSISLPVNRESRDEAWRRYLSLVRRTISDDE